MIAGLFYLASLLALICTIAALTRTNASHALIYLILSLLAVAVLFFLLGAPFAAALEVLIYAGAIMVLFVFVVMMLNLGETGEEREKQWLGLRAWIPPGIIAAVLLLELLYAIDAGGVQVAVREITPKEVGLSLYGPYVLAVEISAMLLMSALVGAYHVARTYLARGQADLARGQADLARSQADLARGQGETRP